MPRKPHSVIRENIKKILSVIPSIDGYSLYKIYIRLFPKVTQRSIYYHLSKGVELKEFKIDSVKKIVGNFSWGDSSRKVFYSIEPNTRLILSNEEKTKIKEIFDEIISK